MSPFLPELLRLEEQAKQQGLGRWSKVHILILSPLLYRTLNCSLIYYLLLPLPRGLLISSVLLLVLENESPVLVIRAYCDLSKKKLEHIVILRCHQDNWIFIIFRAEIVLIWLALGVNFLLNGICHFLQPQTDMDQPRGAIPSQTIIGEFSSIGICQFFTKEKKISVKF